MPHRGGSSGAVCGCSHRARSAVRRARNRGSSPAALAFTTLLAFTAALAFAAIFSPASSATAAQAPASNEPPGLDGPRTVFVVRHAEKAAEPAEDPPLTEQGIARAQELMRVLSECSVEAVFATNTKRSEQTVEPLSFELALVPTTLEADDPYGMAEAVLKCGRRVVLATGHSDTVARIVEGLGVREPLPDSAPAFDDLFVVTIFAPGRASVLRLKYGQPVAG